MPELEDLKFRRVAIQTKDVNLCHRVEGNEEAHRNELSPVELDQPSQEHASPSDPKGSDSTTEPAEHRKQTVRT